MPTTLAQLAELVQGRLSGNGDLPISGAATLETVESDQITLADHADRIAELAASSAAAAIVNAEVDSATIPTIVVEDVHAAFAQVVLHFRPQRMLAPIGISPTAYVSSTASIADGVEIHPGATVDEQVVIGPGSIIHSGVRLMAGCQIGSEVTIFPNAVLYEDTRVGDRAIIHAGAVLGAHGFGYKEIEGRHQLSAQLGNVVIGNDVEIGACATVDCGTYGPTIVGEGSKVDDLVQIAHNCRIGKHNLICGQVGIAGSTTTGDYVVMAGQVGVRDHVHIGERAVLCSKAGVPNNVADGEVVLGQPATPIRQQKLQMAAISKLPEMRKQFKAMQRELAALQAKLDQETDRDSSDQAA
ncbi:MAG: UDP-3-O-(3-hydroxymyristoyl)glucosamine N-acyltransferase [Planctomycetota bacterium]